MKRIKCWMIMMFFFGLTSNLYSQENPDETAIKTLVKKVTEAWNNHDSDSLASLVDESVIYVSSDSQQVHGKEAYLDLHKRVLENATFKNSRSHSTLRNLHIFPASNGGNSLAVLDVQWRLSNIQSTENQDAPARRGHSDLILKKSGDGAWKIIAHRTFRLESQDSITVIKEAFAKRQESWNKQDMDGLLSVIADDINYESSGGEMISGKEALKKKYLSLFTGPLKNSKSTYAVEQVQFVQDDIALVDAAWTLETENGKSKNGKSIILMRKFLEREWKIVSLRPRIDKSEN